MSVLRIVLATALLALAGGAPAAAQHHQQHPRHNMLLFGSSEVFASHIVYKQPHNYQAVLRVRFDRAAQKAYLAARRAHPDATFVLLLDHMDMSAMPQATELTGSVLRRDADGGAAEVIVPGVRLGREDFEVMYFSELPLSLL